MLYGLNRPFTQQGA